MQKLQSIDENQSMQNTSTGFSIADVELSYKLPEINKKSFTMKNWRSSKSNRGIRDFVF